MNAIIINMSKMIVCKIYINNNHIKNKYNYSRQSQEKSIEKIIY